MIIATCIKTERGLSLPQHKEVQPPSPSPLVSTIPSPYCPVPVLAHRFSAPLAFSSTQASLAPYQSDRAPHPFPISRTLPGSSRPLRAPLWLRHTPPLLGPSTLPLRAEWLEENMQGDASLQCLRSCTQLNPPLFQVPIQQLSSSCSAHFSQPNYSEASKPYLNKSRLELGVVA